MRGLSRSYRFLGFVAAVALGSCYSTGCELKASAAAQAAPAGSSVTLDVQGMTCGSCAFTIRTVLRKLDGVKDAKVSQPNHQAVVVFDPAKVTPKQLIEAIDRAGYKASLPAAKGS